MTENSNGVQPAAAPSAVRRLDGEAADRLAGQAAVFEDLQYVLQCCEHLVAELASTAAGPLRRPVDGALVEALWTGALVGYVRCFSGRAAVLSEADLTELELEGDVVEFHAVLKQLRDAWASRHANPRESFSIGVAQGEDGKATGVAVVAAPRPIVEDSTVRLLGRVAYALSGLLDARMRITQNDVLGAAATMTPAELGALPLVELTATDLPAPSA